MAAHNKDVRDEVFATLKRKGSKSTGKREVEVGDDDFHVLGGNG